MKGIKFIWILLFVSSCMMAQSEVKDFAFYEKKLGLYPKNSDSLVYYATKILSEAKKVQAKKETGIAYKFLAEAAFIKGNDNEAIALVNKAFFCFKDLDAVQEDLADCNRILGRIETLKEKFDVAYEYLIKAKLLYKDAGKLKNPDNHYFVLNNIAYLYILTEKYDKALEILNANLKQPVSDAVLANIYSLFSIIANEQGDSKESIKYFKHTKIIYERLKEYNAALICDMNIAINHYYLKEYVTAVKGLKEVLQKASGMKLNSSVVVRANMFLSLCYFEQKEYDTADAYFRITEGYIRKGGMDYVSIQHIWMETKVNFLIHKKSYAEAKELLFSNLVNEKNMALPTKIAFYKLLKLIAEKTENRAETKKYNDSISEFQLENELKSQTKIIDLMRAEFKFNAMERELELKNKEFELLQLKEKKSQQMLLGGIGFGAVLLVFFYVLYSRNKKMNAMREAILIKEKQYLESVNRQKALEIDFKNKEIVDFALHVSEKNEILSEIKSRLKELPSKDSASQHKVNDLLFFINSTIHQNSEKAVLYSEAQEVKDSFLQKLQALFPDLTDKETRVASLVRMQFSSKQIGEQLNITSASVDNYRSVLRKKMKIDKEQTLQDFLKEIG